MTALKKFDPYQMSGADVLRVATGRARVVDDIMSEIERNRASGPGTLQHLAVVAPRGTGKTFLFRLLGLEVERRREEGADLAFLHLPEELPFVDAPAILIREILVRLTCGRPTDNAIRWQSAVNEWEDLCRQLDDALAERFGPGRGLLVLGVENIEELLSDAFPEAHDRRRLRAWLDRPGGRIMLIASSSRGRFDQKPTEPLFGIVRTIELKDWRLPQTVEYFDKAVSALTGKACDPHQLIKARAIAAFTGGSPRMAAALANIIGQNEPLTAAQTLAALIDDLTDYYRDRLKNLGKRARKCLDSLLRFGEPVSQSALAARLGVTQNTVAQAFKELRDKALLAEERLAGSKEVLYRVADRVFAHYYRVRHLHHGSVASPLEHLVELLVTVYTPEERAAESERLFSLGLAADAGVLLRTLPRDADGPDDLDYWDGLRSFIGEVLHYSVRWQVPAGPWRVALLELREFRGNPSALGERLLGLRSDDNQGEALRHMAAGLAFLCDLKTGLALRQFTLAAEPGVDHRLTALALLGKGMAHNCQRSWTEGITMARAAVDQAKAANDPILLARAWRILGYCAWRVGCEEECTAAYEAARDVATSAGDPNGAAWALINLSSCEYRRQNIEQSLNYLRQAYDYSKQINDRIEQSRVISDLASLSNERGDREAARQYAVEAIGHARRAEDAYETVRSLTTSAVILVIQGQSDEALGYGREAVAVAERSGSDLLIRHAKASLAVVLSASDPLSEAAAAEALALADEVLSAQDHGAWGSTGCLPAWWAKANTYGKRRRYAECLEAAVHLRDLARRADDSFYLSRAPSFIVFAFAGLGRFEEGVTAGCEALRELSQLNSSWPTKEVNIYRNMLSCLSRLGRTAEMPGLIAQAVERFRSIGADVQLAEMLEEAIVLALSQDEESAVSGYLEEWGRLLAKGAIKAPSDSHLVDFLIAVTVTGAWPQVGSGFPDDVWASAADRWAGGRLAVALARHAGSKGRPAAFAAFSGLIEALASRLPAETDSPVESIIDRLLDGFTGVLDDPGLLTDMASSLAERWPGRFEERLGLLNAAAQFHAGGRDPAVLARLDPDIATTLRQIWLPEPPE